MIIRKQIGLVEGEASAAEVVAACHERTKHHFHRYAASPGYMDWATQPDPFRRYAGADLVPASLGLTAMRMSRGMGISRRRSARKLICSC